MIKIEIEQVIMIDFWRSEFIIYSAKRCVACLRFSYDHILYLDVAVGALVTLSYLL